MAFSYRMGRSTVNAILVDTCKVLWNVVGGEFVKPPQTPQDWLTISQDFWQKWNFPNCIGAFEIIFVMYSV